jgi:hypothetical protein
VNISMPTLADRAMLVYVSISCWSARKLDKKQTQKTVAEAGATADAARVNKHLLANADSALKKIQQKANQIRDYLEANTLPWDDAGNRLLSNEQSLVVVGQLHTLEQEFKALVDEFIEEYPVLRAEAVKNLGDMGDDSDYPQPDQVRAKFKVSVTFSPLPVSFGDVRTGMSAEQAKVWQSVFEDKVKAQANRALRSAYDRLREHLAKYVDRLQPREDDPERVRVFRDSMVENLRETCDLLDSLNVFDDPELRQLNRHVRRGIAAHDPETLRGSVEVAEMVRREADDVLKRMEEFLL